MELTGWNHKLTAKYFGVHRNTLSQWLKSEKGLTNGRIPSSCVKRFAFFLFYLFKAEETQKVKYINKILKGQLKPSQSATNGVDELLRRLGNDIKRTAKLLNTNNRTIRRWVADNYSQNHSGHYCRTPPAAVIQYVYFLNELLEEKRGAKLVVKFEKNCLIGTDSGGK
jgi:hypothetical protein